MFMLLRLAALTSVFFISHVFGLAIPLVQRDQLCNGHAELCDRKYGNTTFFGAHDSFAASGNPFAHCYSCQDPRGGCGYSVDDGREVVTSTSTHSLFDGGKVLNYFKKVKNFLDRHPNDIVTLIIANPEDLSAAKVWQPVFESSGLANMSYIPSKSPMTREDWPTLKEMLDSGRRFVVFMDKGAEKEPVDYIIPQFDTMWEDEYDPTNSSFPCKVDRTSGSLSPDQKLNLINQNLNVNVIPFGRGLRIPDRLHSPMTNSVDSIMAHADHCAPFAGGNRPNFVLVDFVNIGRGLAAVAKLNGFPY